MDGVEQAIRNALAKGDAESRAFRERVYLSAMSALEKSISARTDTAPEESERRRKSLRQLIQRIETEFLPAVEPESPAPSPAPATPPRASAAPPVTPPSRHAAPSAPVAEPEVPPVARPERAESAATGPDADFTSELRAPDRDDAPTIGEETGGPVFSRRRRPFAWLLVAAVVLSFAGIGIWWASSSGLLLSQAERDGSVPNPPPSLGEENFAPADQTTDQLPGSTPVNGDWLTVFTPADPTTAVAPGGTTVSVVDEGTVQALRIQPTSIDSAVLFDIGQGLLQQMAGKRVTFDIVAKTGEEDQSTQMSIRCNFAELGDCGRKRYDVETASNEFLFEMDVPDKAPGSGGSIALTPDISEGRTAVDIISIKVFIPR